MLTGILKVLRLPPQSTFWRFLASLHLSVAGQILKMQRILRQRVWEAAHVQLKVVTMDTDTTVHTVFGKQMGGRKSYNPKNRGKKSFQPILTFLAETREYVSGELRNGDRPTGAQIARHLESVFAGLPSSVESIYAHADSGFYCGRGGGGVRKGECAVHHFGAQDVALGRDTGPLEKDRAEYLAFPCIHCAENNLLDLLYGFVGVPQLGKQTNFTSEDRVCFFYVRSDQLVGSRRKFRLECEHPGMIIDRTTSRPLIVLGAIHRLINIRLAPPPEVVRRPYDRSMFSRSLGRIVIEGRGVGVAVGVREGDRGLARRGAAVVGSRGDRGRSHRGADRSA